MAKKTYMLRLNEPELPLWARVTARAKQDGLPLRALLLALLEAYANGTISLTKTHVT